jgi:hypothetical protein
MLDSGDYILITVKTAIHRCGSFYTKVWGSTFEVEFGGKTFIQIGGFGDDILVSPDDIVNAVPWHIAPTDPNVLVLTNDHESLLEGIGLDNGVVDEEPACIA